MIERGYCIERDHIPLLRMFGLEARNIYCKAVKGETLAACIASFRGVAGILRITAPLDPPRQFGNIHVIGIPAEALREFPHFFNSLKRTKFLRGLASAFQ